MIFGSPRIMAGGNGRPAAAYRQMDRIVDILEKAVKS
jgi:hypothetical protein